MSRGRRERRGLCYKKCKPGYNGEATVCYGGCPTDFKDIGLFCEKPWDLGRGAGHENKEYCESSDARGFSKTGGCEKYGAFWYPKCPENFYNVLCCLCTAKCPEGYTDTGTGCTKPRYSRGAGTLPSLYIGYYIKIFLAVLAFIFLIMIIGICQLEKRNRILDILIRKPTINKICINNILLYYGISIISNILTS